jgi:hypothetical protein
VERYVRYEYASQHTLFLRGSLRNVHMAYTGLATWQWAQNPPPANLRLY